MVIIFSIAEKSAPPLPQKKTTETVPLCEISNNYSKSQVEECGRIAKCKHARPCVFCLLPSNENVSINFRKQIAIELRTS